MMNSVSMIVAVAFVALAAHGASAFTAPRIQSVSSPTMRSMVPRFDPTTQKWSAGDGDMEGAYGIFETVVRNGPLPFISRVTSGGSYEQGVLKLMATEKMGRAEAQGNMDASLENAADWAYQKMQERNGGAKKDYAKSPSPKQFALAGTWSAIVFAFFGSIIVDTVNGKYS
eukprot:CAMPEP_0119013890 /NCGR_PEP_ID=MMETSP1176-20130426/9190_1 /TAXON_ID=265551 /ORGANISM="Synedropsis recta cf, Strain CCMP1620" /LENGTH=170 /DNA_ID=CAMNT_0006967017 /DNA_START=24 /DNA_END=536 /DNA_ORIENTATION=+